MCLWKSVFFQRMAFEPGTFSCIVVFLLQGRGSVITCCEVDWGLFLPMLLARNENRHLGYLSSQFATAENRCAYHQLAFGYSNSMFFPPCQVRVARFYVRCAAPRTSSPPSSSFLAGPHLPALRRAVGLAGLLPDLKSQKQSHIECQRACQIECQIECQKICQIECQKIFQIEWQKICQIEC